MIKLDVWLTIYPKPLLKAGELVVADPDSQGRLIGQSRYSPEYLAKSSVFFLDPINLPLSATVYAAARPHSGVHGVFEDSLPDNWGRRLLVRRSHFLRQQQRVPQLLRSIGAGIMGALAYGVGRRLPRKVGISRKLNVLSGVSRLIRFSLMKKLRFFSKLPAHLAELAPRLSFMTTVMPTWQNLLVLKLRLTWFRWRRQQCTLSVLMFPTPTAYRLAIGKSSWWSGLTLIRSAKDARTASACSRFCGPMAAAISPIPTSLQFYEWLPPTPLAISEGFSPNGVQCLDWQHRRSFKKFQHFQRWQRVAPQPGL
jgi:HipA N-terminal domain